jgi:NADH-quinone oxidoreductase subunit N
VVWVEDVPDGDTSPVKPPAPVVAALVITVIGTIVLGVFPDLVARFGDIDSLTGAFGG